MKSINFWATLIIGLFIYIPTQVFSQNQKPGIIDSLPTNFEYRIDTDSFPYYDVYRSKQINYFKNDMTLGCSNPVEAQLAFALTIYHPFLLEKYDGIIPAKLMLYAVKKSEGLPDSAIVKALKDYCTYGQANYHFQSRDYVLFLYATYTNSQGRVERLEETALWYKIENQLIRNLDSGYPIIAQTQEIIPIDNEFHKSNIVRGKYELCYIGLPSEKINRDGEEVHISGTPDNCPFIVKLKGNNQAKAVNIQNGKRQFKKKWKWYMDTHYVYIDQPNGSGLYAYKMSDESIMYSLLTNKFGGEYLRKLKQ